MSSVSASVAAPHKRIWIDMDNSPHVPFFTPIIRELYQRGYEVMLTTREAFQVHELAARSGLPYTRIGRHYGKNRVAKVGGLFVRALQLAQHAMKDKPALAVSHGSRAQIIAAHMLHMPSLTLIDYEHAKFPPFMRSTWTLVPQIVSDEVIRCRKGYLRTYPGIKEDVYVPSFTPDPTIVQELGLDGLIVVTLRPPATEAHYRNPESDKLFAAAMRLLGSTDGVQTVVLPRNDRQAVWIRSTWPEYLTTGKMIIPNGAVDGLNLLWHSDLVISGGGTMNREAAALGIPVYSIFRGKIGAVDKYLAQNGRLILLESQKDVQTKIRLARRSRAERTPDTSSQTLHSIVDTITDILEYGTKRQCLWLTKSSS